MSITWIETDLSTILTTPTSTVRQLKNNALHRKPKYVNASRPSTLQPTLKPQIPLTKPMGPCKIAEVNIWSPFTESPGGRVASVYWKCDQGVYVSFDDTDTCEFIKLSKRHRWVVDNSEVQIGLLRILCKSGTDDMQDEFKTFGDREMKKRSAMVLLNDVFFGFQQWITGKYIHVINSKENVTVF